MPEFSFKSVLGAFTPKISHKRPLSNSSPSSSNDAALAAPPAADRSLVSQDGQGSSLPAVPAAENIRTHAPDSVFENASNFNLGSFNYFQGSAHISTSIDNGSSSRGWDLLVKASSATALYDSAACYDRPKCDEDTRVEVTKEIMDWIKDREAPKRLLYMTGPAGAGKSAIQQTIADNCAREAILAASFFFSATDRSRNDALVVPATIAYQLARMSPVLRSAIGQIVDDDPLVFSKSIESQFNALIVEPLRHYQLALGEHTILIDGVDECIKEERQAELLQAIDVCLLAADLPFRVVVASRPELVVYNALQPSGHLHDKAYHIQLNDQYNPDSDIERFLQRRFEEIASKTTDPRAKVPHWPGEDVKRILIQKASGQFIYAATVMRYLREPRASPVARLNDVLSWTATSRTHPLASLDALYSQILSKARDNYMALDETRPDLVLLLHLGLDSRVQYFASYHTIVFSEPGTALDDLVHDLHSLVEVSTGTITIGKDNTTEREFGYLRAFHYTLTEFLGDPTRAKGLLDQASGSTIRDYLSLRCLSQVETILSLDAIQRDTEENQRVLACSSWILFCFIVRNCDKLEDASSDPSPSQLATRRFIELNLCQHLLTSHSPVLQNHECCSLPILERNLRLKGFDELSHAFAIQLSTYIDTLYKERNERFSGAQSGRLCARCGWREPQSISETYAVSVTQWF